MNQKSYLIILKAGILLSFLSVFLVYPQFLFPYITSKQIYFNVIMEILLVFWLAFIVKYPQWRPPKSKITLGIIAYFGVIFLSCFGSVDFNLSFWGDIERMLGFFHVVHFLILYLILITVLKDWKDWKIFLGLFILTTTIVSLTGIYGDHSYGTIGNSAYVAGMIIFGFYFSLLLMFREKNKYLKLVYLVPIIIMLIEFKKINIAGAFVGLGGSIILAIFLFGLLHKNKRVKIASLSLSIIIISSLSFAITHKNYGFIKGIRSIQDLSLQERTLRTRFIAWKGAWDDFGNHWLMGTGYGTFASTFDEYFDPKFYDITRSGTYFDRAHNNLIGIASTTGMIGLLTYLSIFLFVFLAIIKAFRNGRLKTMEFILLFSLISAYFVQNLAVFDSLATYIGLMLMLGFVYYISTTDKDMDNSTDLLSADQPLINREIYMLFGFGFFMLIIIYQYNLAVASMLRSTIYAQAMLSNNQIEKAVEVSKNSAKTPMDRDSRSAFIRGFLSHSNGLNKLSDEKRKKIIDYVISLSEQNVARDPEDSLMEMRLSQMLNFASRYSSKDKKLFTYYHQKALTAISKSMETSPGRIATYSIKAYIQLTGGDTKGAIDTLKQGISLNSFYEPTYCQIAEVYLISKDNDNGYKSLNKCIELDGINNIRSQSVIKKAINHYASIKDTKSMLIMYQHLASLNKKDPEIWIRLAKLYLHEHKFKEAKKAAITATKIDSKLKSDVADFIEQVDALAGQNK